jgi:hypothetical protein
MGTLFRPLMAGSVITFTVTAAWACTTAITAAGPAPTLHLTRSLPSDYVQLASGATSSVPVLFAVIALIYAACFAAAGYRRGRHW